MASVPPERTTRDRIVDASIALFNSEGVDGTSVVAIGERAGVATGNLTYYFPRKRDIVFEILDRFETSIDELQSGLLADIVTGTKSVTPAETVTLLACITRVIWRNRFFFSSTMALHRLDKAIPARFTKIEARARNGISQLIQKTLDGGVLTPLRYPNTVQHLAENIWYLLWGCMFFQRIRAASAEALEADVVHSTLMHLAALIEPHIAREFSIAVCDEINKL
ncbi:MAG: TetR/AcrR family transcriptional regulator [Caulobacterales bacterium]